MIKIPKLPMMSGGKSLRQISTGSEKEREAELLLQLSGSISRSESSHSPVDVTSSISPNPATKSSIKKQSGNDDVGTNGRKVLKSSVLAKGARPAEGFSIAKKKKKRDRKEARRKGGMNRKALKATDTMLHVFRKFETILSQRAIPKYQPAGAQQQKSPTVIEKDQFEDSLEAPLDHHARMQQQYHALSAGNVPPSPPYGYFSLHPDTLNLHPLTAVQHYYPSSVNQHMMMMNQPNNFQSMNPIMQQQQPYGQPFHPAMQMHGAPGFHQQQHQGYGVMGPYHQSQMMPFPPQQQQSMAHPAMFQQQPQQQWMQQNPPASQQAFMDFVKMQQQQQQMQQQQQPVQASPKEMEKSTALGPSGSGGAVVFGRKQQPQSKKETQEDLQEEKEDAAAVIASLRTPQLLKKQKPPPATTPEQQGQVTPAPAAGTTQASNPAGPGSAIMALAAARANLHNPMEAQALLLQLGVAGGAKPKKPRSQTSSQPAPLQFPADFYSNPNPNQPQIPQQMMSFTIQQQQPATTAAQRSEQTSSSRQTSSLQDLSSAIMAKKIKPTIKTGSGKHQQRQEDDDGTDTDLEDCGFPSMKRSITTDETGPLTTNVEELLTLPMLMCVQPDDNKMVPVRDREFAECDVLLGRGGMTNHHVVSLSVRPSVSCHCFVFPSFANSCFFHS